MSGTQPIPTGVSFDRGTFGGKVYDWESLLTEKGAMTPFQGKLSSFKAGATRQCMARKIDHKRLQVSTKGCPAGHVAVRLSPVGKAK